MNKQLKAYRKSLIHQYKHKNGMLANQSCPIGRLRCCYGFTYKFIAWNFETELKQWRRGVLKGFEPMRCHYERLAVCLGEDVARGVAKRRNEEHLLKELSYALKVERNPYIED